MSKNIENETRVMLTVEQYQALKEYASSFKHHEFVLTNHYFDDEDLSLRKAHFMLRIRNTDSTSYEITLKIKGDNGDLEVNHPISNNEVDELIKDFNYQDEEISTYLDKVRHKKIRYITSLKTERIEIQFDNYLFVLDKNYYSDVIDYNLEIEANDISSAEQAIKKYCNKFGMQYSKHYLSKSRRAINKALNI